MKYTIFPFLFFIQILSAQPILLRIMNPVINGNQVTYDVRASNINELLSMKFCISYDQDTLSFNRVKNIISFMGTSNFITSPGSICINWLSPTLESVTFPDSTLLFQIIFNKLHSEDGDVCFSQEPYPSEFYVGEEVQTLSSFLVTDDCHIDTFEVYLTSVSEVEPQYFELHFQSFSFSDQILFNLDQDRSLEFYLFDLAGIQIQRFPKTNYGKGKNIIDVKTKLPPGLYILSTHIQNQQISIKIILP